MVEDYEEEQRSCRSQKVASERSSKIKNDHPMLAGQTSSEGMLGKAAIITPILKEQSESNIDEEDDFADAKPSEESTLTEVFLSKFSSNEGKTYRLCPYKWTINDQGFGTDVTCCSGECQPKSF